MKMEKENWRHSFLYSCYLSTAVRAGSVDFSVKYTKTANCTETCFVYGK